MVGTYQSMPMRIFSFKFVIGSGRSTQTLVYTVVEASVQSNLPDILLLSKEHQNEVSDFFSGDDTIDLEGDFNKYFKLRVPKGYEQEAYQIFTPDVMAALIDKEAGLSFEFIGNKLYIYATKVITKRAEFQAMFDLSEYLISLFKKNVGSIVVNQNLTVSGEPSPVTKS